MCSFITLTKFLTSSSSDLCSFKLLKISPVKVMLIIYIVLLLTSLYICKRITLKIMTN